MEVCLKLTVKRSCSMPLTLYGTYIGAVHGITDITLSIGKLASMDSTSNVLEVCALCRLVHDETLGGWVSKQAYRNATGTDPITCDQSHTYCPDCYAFCLAKIQAA